MKTLLLPDISLIAICEKSVRHISVRIVSHRTSIEKTRQKNIKMADIAKTCDIQVTKKRIAGLQLGVFVVVKTFCQVVTFWKKSLS